MQQQQIMREQQKCVYVRFFRFPTFFHCAHAALNRAICCASYHDPPPPLNKPPAPPTCCTMAVVMARVSQTTSGAPCLDYFCPMSAYNYKYYVYAVEDAAPGKRRPQMELFAINIRHIYMCYNFYRFTSAVHSLPLGWSC